MILHWFESLSRYAAIAILFNGKSQFEKLFYQSGQVLIIYEAKDGILTSEKKYQINNHKLLYNRWGFVLQRQFHVIAGDGYYYHLRWDDNDRKFKKLHDLGQYGNDITIKDAIKTSKNKLWIIGYDKEYNFVIQEYLNDQDLWINKISLTLNRSHIRNELTTKLCCVSVYNNTLLIIIGNEKCDDGIHVIDIGKKTFRLSSVRLPCICKTMYASSTRNQQEDEMLVYGYCKQIEKEHLNVEFNIPHYLMELITCWMITEFLQIFCGKGGNISWRVNVDDILQFQDDDNISSYDVPSGFLNIMHRYQVSKTIYFCKWKAPNGECPGGGYDNKGFTRVWTRDRHSRDCHHNPNTKKSSVGRPNKKK